MSKCKSEYGDKCAVYSVGDQVVVGFSKRKLAAAIEAHDRRNKKIVTASTSSTSFGTTPTYCKMPDGRVYLRAPGSHCAYNKEITKAEYDRLKGQTVEERRKAEREAERRKQERQAREKREQERIAREQQEVEKIAGEHAALPELDVLDAPHVVLKNANVRERPDVKSPRVTILSKGSEITALGKVKGNNWYLVSRDGKELGYVFGTLLSELETEPETRFAAAPEPKAVKAHGNKDAVAVIIGNKNYAQSPVGFELTQTAYAPGRRMSDRPAIRPRQRTVWRPM